MSSPSTPIKALIIDSDSQTVEIISTHLKQYIPLLDLTLLHQATEAIETLKKTRSDLVFIDISIKGLDGTTLLNLLKSIDPSLRPSRLILMAPNIPSVAVPETNRPIIYFCKPLNINSLKNYLVRAYPPPEKILPKVVKIDPLVAQTYPRVFQFVMKQFSNIDVKRTNMEILPNDSSLENDIISQIAVTSHRFIGKFIVSSPKETYLAIVNHMLGTEYAEINSENQDMLGEVCNQVFCLARRELNEHGFDIGMARPENFTPTDRKLNCSPAPLLWLTYSYECAFGSLRLDMHILSVPNRE